MKTATPYPFYTTWDINIERCIFQKTSEKAGTLLCEYESSTTHNISICEILEEVKYSYFNKNNVTLPRMMVTLKIEYSTEGRSGGLKQLDLVIYSYIILTQYNNLSCQ